MSTERKVKRVKAWAMLIDGELLNVHDVYETEKEANSEAQEAFEDTPSCTYMIVPCTITYTEPAKRKAARCLQCGKTFRAKPCGFSHAEIGGWRPVQRKGKVRR